MTAIGRHSEIPHWHPAKVGYEHNGEIVLFNGDKDHLSLPELIEWYQVHRDHLSRWMGDAGLAGDRELGEMLQLRLGTADATLRVLRDAYERIRFARVLVDPNTVHLPSGRVEHRDPPTAAERAAAAEQVWQEWVEPHLEWLGINDKHSDDNNHR